MHPEASQLYCKMTGDVPETLSEMLMDLKDLFQRLADDLVSKASIERIEAVYFGGWPDRDERQMHNLRIRYEREKDFAYTRSKFMNYHPSQFKHG